MSRPDDVPSEMTSHEMDDATAERLLRGSAAPEQADLEPLGLLLSEVRALGLHAPEPSPALAALLRDGFTPAAAAPSPAPAAVSWRRRLGALAGASLGAKVLLGAGVAVAAVGSAAGAGVLPEAVEDRLRDVFSAVTPFQTQPGDRVDPLPVPASPSATPSRATPTLPTPAPLSSPARGTAPSAVPAATPTPQPPLRPLPEPAASQAEERRPSSPGAARPSQRPSDRPQQRPTAPPSRAASPEGSPAAAPRTDGQPTPAASGQASSQASAQPTGQPAATTAPRPAAAPRRA